MVQNIPIEVRENQIPKEDEFFIHIMSCVKL